MRNSDSTCRRRRVAVMRQAQPIGRWEARAAVWLQVCADSFYLSSSANWLAGRPTRPASEQRSSRTRYTFTCSATAKLAGGPAAEPALSPRGCGLWCRPATPSAAIACKSLRAVVSARLPMKRRRRAGRLPIRHRLIDSLCSSSPAAYRGANLHTIAGSVGAPGSAASQRAGPWVAGSRPG